MNGHALDRRQHVPTVAATGFGFVRTRRRPVKSAIRRATDLAMDLVVLIAAILFFPTIILAIGIPVALVLQLLFWIGGLL